ncbi:MAG: class II aldolase/adducin family protein [Candidatus Bathyarchaeia archaeon]
MGNVPSNVYVEEDLRRRLAEAGRKLFKARLTPGTSGNISARIPGALKCLIKPSGKSFKDLKADDFLLVDINTRAVLKGVYKPSIETPFHTALYKLRDSIGAVVHTHSHYATLLSIAEIEVLPIGMEVYQAPALAQGVGLSKYAPPGTEELAKNIVEAMKGKSAVLLPHHGAATVGRTIEEAVNNACVLERLARLNYEVLNIAKPTPLPNSVLKEIAESADEVHGKPIS